MSYTQQRASLDSLPPLRVPRSHYVSLISPSDFGRPSISTLTGSEISTFRSSIITSFPRSSSSWLAVENESIINYVPVDQEYEGACTFVSLINCSMLVGSQNVFTRPLTKVAKDWKSIWAKIVKLSQRNDDVVDIAEMLDLSFQKNLLKPDSKITYTPIRSSGNREMSFNKSFYTPTPLLLSEKYNVTISDINAAPFVYQNAFYIESHLSSSTPLIINFAEHTRTCVGYNSTSLIFCDNWNPGIEVKDDTEYESYWKGGLSVVDKWAVYSWVREVLIVEREEEKGGKSVDDAIEID
ncbi:hypothetical protein TrST_g13046 [Triparma strigata]|uniref:Cysteine proteinase n=1 Tax=Triparma strigata TaxID=1606541 RepID=A0A9W6ZXN3_9STRA|nr:hypothetical protein TrST_g13046 [Triparma strigata]